MDGVQNPQSQGSQNQNSKRKCSRPNFAAGASSASSSKRGPSLSSKVLVGVLVLVGLVILAAFAARAFGVGESSQVDKDRFQAVFLTNGQVYFGNLDDINDPYVKLTNIYYLQVSQTQGEESEERLQPAGQNQQISLAKLGNELHGPQDEMYISRDQVLFWENLKDEGQVTQAIQDFQAQQGDGDNADQNADEGDQGGEEQ